MEEKVSWVSVVGDKTGHLGASVVKELAACAQVKGAEFIFPESIQMLRAGRNYDFSRAG